MQNRNKMRESTTISSSSLFPILFSEIFMHIIYTNVKGNKLNLLDNNERINLQNAYWNHLVLNI